MIDKVFISWIGPTSLGVELNGVVKGFSLEEGQVVPPEFKVGDLVELHLEGDATAEIWGIGNSRGCYSFKHIASGKEFKTWHRAEAYRFDPLVEPREGKEKSHPLMKSLQLFKVTYGQKGFDPPVGTFIFVAAKDSAHVKKRFKHEFFKGLSIEIQHYDCMGEVFIWDE